MLIKLNQCVVICARAETKTDEERATLLLPAKIPFLAPRHIGSAGISRLMLIAGCSRSASSSGYPSHASPPALPRSIMPTSFSLSPREHAPARWPTQRASQDCHQLRLIATAKRRYHHEARNSHASAHQKRRQAMAACSAPHRSTASPTMQPAPAAFRIPCAPGSLDAAKACYGAGAGPPLAPPAAAVTRARRSATTASARRNSSVMAPRAARSSRSVGAARTAATHLPRAAAHTADA